MSTPGKQPEGKESSTENPPGNQPPDQPTPAKKPRKKEAPTKHSPNKITPVRQPAKLNPNITPFKPRTGAAAGPGPALPTSSGTGHGSGGPAQRPAAQTQVTPSRPGTKQLGTKKHRGQGHHNYQPHYRPYPAAAAPHQGPQYGVWHGPYPPQQFNRPQSVPPQPMAYSTQDGAALMSPYRPNGPYQQGQASITSTYPGRGEVVYSGYFTPSVAYGIPGLPPEQMPPFAMASHLAQLEKNQMLSGWIQAYEAKHGRRPPFIPGVSSDIPMPMPPNSAAEENHLRPILAGGTSPAKSAVPTAAGREMAIVATPSSSQRATQAKPGQPVGSHRRVGGSHTPSRHPMSSNTPVRGPNNAAVGSAHATNANDLTSRPPHSMWHLRIKEKIAAEKAKAAKEAEAAQALAALHQSVEAVTAEVHAAFAEVDELVAEFNRAPAARADAPPKPSASGESKGASKAMTQQTNVVPSRWTGEAHWPHQWTLATPRKKAGTPSISSEEADEDNDELTSSYKAAAKKTALLGLETSPPQPVQKRAETKDTVSVRSVRVAYVVDHRGLTVLQVGAKHGEHSKVPVAAQASRKIVAPVVPAVPAISAIRARAQSLTAQSKSPADLANRSLESNEQGQSQTASPLPKADTQATVQWSAAMPETKEKPVSRRASDIRVAVPELSLLPIPHRASNAVKESTGESTQTKATREVLKAQVAPPKAPAKKRDTSKQETVVLGGGPLDACVRALSEALDGLHLDFTRKLAANQSLTRIINPPPGFPDLHPVVVSYPHLRSLTTRPSASARVRPPEPIFNTQNPRQRLPDRAPGRSYYKTIPWPAPKRQLSDKLVKISESSESSTGFYRRSASSHPSQDNMDDNRLSVPNMAGQGIPAPAAYLQWASGISKSPFAREPTADHTRKEQASVPAAAGTESNDHTTDTLTESELAAIEAMKREWAGCIGKSDDVEVERLPWDRMKKYYPNGPPRHMGRYVPIPDNWQENNPLRLRGVMAGQGMAPEEQRRYQANVDRVFYSGSRFWNMGMDAMVEDVHLRHVFACYLADLGVSRAEFDREYNCYVDAFDNTYVPGPYARMTADELREVPTHEIAGQMLTMAFRNLLLGRAEAALPDGHKTWWSRSFGDYEEPPVTKSRASPYGAIGEERARAKKDKGKGKATDVRPLKLKQTVHTIGEEPEEEDGGETSAAGAKRGERKVRKHKHLLGYAC